MQAKSITLSITPAQRAALEAFDAEYCTVTQAAERLNVQANSITSRLQHATKACGVESLLQAYPHAAPALLKLRDKQARQLQATLQRPQLPAIEAEHPAIVDSTNLLPALQEKIALALSYIDRFAISGAKLSELNTTIKTLFDVAQVLQGKPTSISHTDNVRTLKDLVPALMREASRRGMIDIDGEVVEVREAKHKRKQRSDAGQARPHRRKDSAGASSGALGAESDGSGGGEVGGPRAGGVGGSGSGPINPKGPSEFSKLLEDM